MRELTRLFRTLSDENRLRILRILRTSGELCVCDIEDLMGFTQTKVSRHLAYLRRAGMVNVRRKGLWKIYSLVPPASPQQRRLLDCIDEVLAGDVLMQRDERRLTRNVAAGCCVTFTALKSAPPAEAMEAQRRRP